VVLGDVDEPVGSQGPIYRHLGARVAQVASRAVSIAGQRSGAYAAGARQGGLPRGAVINARGSVTMAVEALKDDLRPGDVVLIKGRDTRQPLGKSRTCRGVFVCPLGWRGVGSGRVGSVVGPRGHIPGHTTDMRQVRPWTQSWRCWLTSPISRPMAS
jgi:hypothetical protein